MINSDGASCDGCSNSESFYRIPFRAIAARIKELGWKIVPDRHTFRHYCPDCVEQKKHLSKEFKTSRPNTAQHYWWQDIP